MFRSIQTNALGNYVSNIFVLSNREGHFDWNEVNNILQKVQNSRAKSKFKTAV